MVLDNGLGLKLGWLLFDHSLSLFSILCASVFCRHDIFYNENLWVGLCLYCSTGVPAWLQVVCSFKSKTQNIYDSETSGKEFLLVLPNIWQLLPIITTMIKLFSVFTWYCGPSIHQNLCKNAFFPIMRMITEVESC